MRFTRRQPQDPQAAQPIVCCTLCGRGLYQGEEYWHINGQQICGDCLLPFARADYAAHHCICGKEDDL